MVGHELSTLAERLGERSIAPLIMQLVTNQQLSKKDMMEIRRLLDDDGLYVAVINGFPYGHFHGKPVKASVYAPDWRDPARVQYTLDLFRILQALLPDAGVHRGGRGPGAGRRPARTPAVAAERSDNRAPRRARSQERVRGVR